MLKGSTRTLKLLSSQTESKENKQVMHTENLSIAKATSLRITYRTQHHKKLHTSPFFGWGVGGVCKLKLKKIRKPHKMQTTQPEQLRIYTVGSIYSYQFSSRISFHLPANSWATHLLAGRPGEACLRSAGSSMSVCTVGIPASTGPWPFRKPGS